MFAQLFDLNERDNRFNCNALFYGRTQSYVERMKGQKAKCQNSAYIEGVAAYLCFY